MCACFVTPDCKGAVQRGLDYTPGRVDCVVSCRYSTGTACSCGCARTHPQLCPGSVAQQQPVFMHFDLFSPLSWSKVPRLMALPGWPWILLVYLFNKAPEQEVLTL